MLFPVRMLLPALDKLQLDSILDGRQRMHSRKLGLPVAGSLMLVLLVRRAGILPVTPAAYSDIKEASIEQLTWTRARPLHQC